MGGPSLGLSEAWEGFGQLPGSMDADAKLARFYESLGPFGIGLYLEGVWDVSKCSHVCPRVYAPDFWSGFCELGLRGAVVRCENEDSLLVYLMADPRGQRTSLKMQVFLYKTSS